MVFFRTILLIVLLPSKAFCQPSIEKKIQHLNQQTLELSVSDQGKAKKQSNEALALIKKHPKIDLITQSDVYSARGTLFQQELAFKPALSHFHKSLRLRLKYGKNKEKISIMYMNIANAFYLQDKPKDALRNYKKALKVALETQNPEDLFSVYNGLSQVYESLYETDSMLVYYTKCAQIIEKLEDTNTQQVADYYSNIAQFYETKKKYDLAEQNLLKAITIESKLDNQSGLAWSYHHLGIIQHEKKQNARAKHFFHVSEKLAKSQNAIEILHDIANSRMLLYSSENEQDSVNYYFYLSDSLNSIINEKITDEQVTEMETKYKTKQQQTRIKSAEERESLLIYSGLSILLALLLLSFFLLRNYRQKQRISLLHLNLKDREINELLGKQENAAYAAMLAGQDEERLRIARELHDRLGSTLATVKLSLQHGSGMKAETQRMQLVNNAISEVREIAHDLSGSNIERYGLYAALEELKQTIEQAGNISFNMYLESQEISAHLHIPIYRIIQELISNTLKHAAATQMNLQLSNQENSLLLIYEDNGRGFSPATTNTGMGLKNIRHRLEKWDGTLEIDSQLHRGSIAIIRIPLTYSL